MFLKRDKQKNTFTGLYTYVPEVLIQLDAPKTLVTYFSASGVTANVANVLAEAICADEIKVLADCVK